MWEVLPVPLLFSFWVWTKGALPNLPRTCSYTVSNFWSYREV